MSSFGRLVQNCVLIWLSAVGSWNAAGARAADVDVRFLVVAPSGDEKLEKIYLSLSTDDWPESGRPLVRIADGLFETRLKLAADAIVQYKFLREPVWASVEKDPRGNEIANRELRVPTEGAELVAFHDIGSWADKPVPPMRRAKYVRGAATHEATAAPDSSRVGEIRVHPTLLDEKTGRTREVHVYLPPGYDKDPKQRYPVLYMQDGQNLFDAETAFGGVEWELDETLERLISAGKLPPLIVVGVYHAGEKRVDEYAAARDESRGAGGGAEAYLDFLTKTIKPIIDKTYRTLPDAPHTGIGGSSMGGLISMYAVWTRPQVFGKAAVMSPAVWFADGAILKTIAERDAPTGARIWVDVGTAEGNSSEDRAKWVAHGRRLAEAIRARGVTDESRLHYEEVSGAPHHEAAWAARIDRVLLYLFGK